jgi:CRISPR-associated endonuclease/helicase Cas3
MVTVETIAHIYYNEDTKEWIVQSYEEHQKGVAVMAKDFGAQIGCPDLCYIIGMLHDEGKKQKSFQRYICRVSGYISDLDASEHPNHAYIGSVLSKKLLPHYVPLLFPPIYSHHSGLKDSRDYKAELTLPTDDAFIEPLISNITAQPALPQWAGKSQRRDFHHIQRMLFSCLVDADFLDTETFMQGGHSRKEYVGRQSSISELLDVLENFLEYKGNHSEKTSVNEIRQEIQNICRQHATQPRGIYSLTVPTGGGKTLSGLLWALRHAAIHNLSRVIIAIPYTSIITQTAQVLRDIFGENNVLEHHSAFDAEKIAEQREEVDIDELSRRQRLASENWDYPIVVTTNVQLFQSMMASKPSKCRKLHNVAKSVIILDEAQMLPCEHLQPIMDSLDTYQRLFSCSILLATASQPVFNDNRLRAIPNCLLKGLDNVSEIMPIEMRLHERLRRVDICFDEEESEYDDIADRMMQYDRVLCIVSTRKIAMEIFKRLPQEEGNYHLSRMMCSEHLSETLGQIRTALSKSDSIVRVVSTQLIEAGVDVDFPVVMRQEAGLDSILQAAGRCNREGRMQEVSSTCLNSISHCQEDS